MENEVLELLTLTRLRQRELAAQQTVLTEAVLQLVEHLLAPEPAARQRFADAMRSRLQAILAETADSPDALEESQMTAVLAALLQSAGVPPQT